MPLGFHRSVSILAAISVQVSIFSTDHQGVNILSFTVLKRGDSSLTFLATGSSNWSQNFYSCFETGVFLTPE